MSDDKNQTNPQSLNDYINRGITRFRNGDYDQAIADFTQAIALDPKDVLAYIGRGNSWRNKGDYDQAIADYTQAIAPDSEGAVAHCGRCLAYIQQKNDEKAKQDWKDALSRSQEPLKGKHSFYKYIPIETHHLYSLKKRRCYFAEIASLNDPLECFFLKKYPSLSGFLKEYKMEPRVLSLSSLSGENDSMRMFSHYADRHQGCCVEYEFDFDELSKTDIAYGHVKYKLQNTAQELTDLYLLKDPEWKDEQEFRLLRIDGEKFLDKFITIKSVCFGYECVDSSKELIRQVLDGQDVDYYQMIADSKGGNQINREKI